MRWSRDQTEAAPNESVLPPHLLAEFVTRDICMLFHELVDYQGIMPDLDYYNLYRMPYWQYLNWQGADPTSLGFIREGCLVMLFAMALDELQGSGAFLTLEEGRFPAAQEQLDEFVPLSEREGRLRDAVRAAFGAMSSAPGPPTSGPVVLSDFVEREASWIREEVIRSYFQSRS